MLLNIMVNVTSNKTILSNQSMRKRMDVATLMLIGHNNVYEEKNHTMEKVQF